MRMKCFALGLLAALILASSGGCKKSASDSAVNQKPEIKNQKTAVLARVHWLGRNRIAAETNAARFMSLWNLPESTRLEIQTLDKIAIALTGEPPLVNTNLVPVAWRPAPDQHSSRRLPTPWLAKTKRRWGNSQPSTLNQIASSA